MDTKVIYHYTTQDALLNIIDKEELWATDIFYLNDFNEVRLAIRLASEKLQKMSESYSNEDLFDRIDIASGLPIPSSKERLALASMFRTIETFDKRPIKIYVCSFSEKGDLLSQWRGYSRGDPACSIGCKFNVLAELASEKHFSLEKCIYEESEQENDIRNITKHIFNAITEEDQNSRTHITDNLKLLIRNLFKLAPTIKDTAFKEEEEWRLISTLEYDCKPKFRKGLSMIVPYVCFPIVTKEGKPIIDSIRISPLSHPELSELSINSVKALLESKGQCC